MATKQVATEPNPDQFYTVLHTMISVPQHVLDDAIGAQMLDASFLTRGDVVSEALFGGMHVRLLKVGAIRQATVEESRSEKAINYIRRASNEDDATHAANLNLEPNTHEVKA